MKRKHISSQQVKVDEKKPILPLHKCDRVKIFFFYECTDTMLPRTKKKV